GAVLRPPFANEGLAVHCDLLRGGRICRHNQGDFLMQARAGRLPHHAPVLPSDVCSRARGRVVLVLPKLPTSERAATGLVVDNARRAAARILYHAWRGEPTPRPTRSGSTFR